MSERAAGPNAIAPRKTLAVALHGIEPATFERCALIRDWLGDRVRLRPRAGQRPAVAAGEALQRVLPGPRAHRAQGAGGELLAQRPRAGELDHGGRQLLRVALAEQAAD